MPEQLASLRHIAPLLTEVRSLFVSGCAAQIPNLERVFTESEGKDPLTVSGIFVPGVNTVDYAAACERVRCQTYFMTPQMASADHDRVQYCPWRYSDIVAFYRSNPVDVALVFPVHARPFVADHRGIERDCSAVFSGSSRCGGPQWTPSRGI